MRGMKYMKTGKVGRVSAVAVLAVAITGCALLQRPSMRDISDEMGMDLLSNVLTALDADDFDYFMTSFDVGALAAAHALAPVNTATLPRVKEIIRGHFTKLRDLKGEIGTSLSFYAAVGSRAGPIQLSIAGAVSSTPLDACPPGRTPVAVSKNRGFWLIHIGGSSLKVRLVRNGPWKIEDIEWNPVAR